MAFGAASLLEIRVLSVDQPSKRPLGGFPLYRLHLTKNHQPRCLENTTVYVTIFETFCLCESFVMIGTMRFFYDKMR